MDDDMMEELRMRGISVEDYIKKNMMAAEGGEDDLEDEFPPSDGEDQDVYQHEQGQKRQKKE